MTTDASSRTVAWHPRMPVLLDLDSAERWLDRTTPLEAALRLLRPYEDADLECYQVSKLVNSPANDSPECIAPVVPEEDDSSLTLDLFDQSRMRGSRRSS